MMWMSWKSRLTCMLRDFVGLKKDPEDFYGPLVGLKAVRVECAIQYPSRMPVEVPMSDGFEWLMTERLKREGIATTASRKAPGLQAIIRSARCISPDLMLFSVQTRLVRSDAGAGGSDTVLWRSFRVVGVTTLSRLWYDVNATLYGQVEQFAGDHSSINETKV